MSDGYKKPNRFGELVHSKSFSRYFGISMVAIFVILAFMLFVWLAGAPVAGIPDEIFFLQLETPADDAPVVVFETNLGTMKAVLYPDETPNYYAYFTNLVESGYYDGTYVCALVDGAYSLGGTKSPDPNDAEVEGADMTRIQAEISNNLWPIKGALVSYIGDSGVWPFEKRYAGSSVIFVNDLDDPYMAEDALKRSYGEALGGVFSEYGGIPTFSRKYTVFGQIYDGWEVWEAINSATALETYQPADEIIFEKVYLSTYGAEKPTE
ncbi:MAG: peptidylprolyl isomerase [Oscillospiraceae bacterium]|nr:peptidylprolyl isomerase [Oscillospiraceae bacterium]